jgi:hypothetical protein
VTDLVLANRILASDEVGILTVGGHVSYRSPQPIRRISSSRATGLPVLVTARDVYESDLDGKPVSGGAGDLYAERFIRRGDLQGAAGGDGGGRMAR